MDNKHYLGTSLGFKIFGLVINVISGILQLRPPQHLVWFAFNVIFSFWFARMAITHYEQKKKQKNS